MQSVYCWQLDNEDFLSLTSWVQLYAGLAARFSGNNCLPLVGNLFCRLIGLFFNHYEAFTVFSGCIFEL